MSETRKIAAILVSDVVGYSRLAGADEDRTLARLSALRSDLIDPTIAAHHGRIVKRTGDGASSSSAAWSTRCVARSRCKPAWSTGMPAFRLSAASNFASAFIWATSSRRVDGDLMGDGVNIAARLEGVAEPGAICLSEDAYRQVKGGSIFRSAISARSNSRTSPSRSASIRCESASRLSLSRRSQPGLRRRTRPWRSRRCRTDPRSPSCLSRT